MRFEHDRPAERPRSSKAVAMAAKEAGMQSFFQTATSWAGFYLLIVLCHYLVR